MISLNWRSLDGQIGSLMKRYADLPRFVAKKHLGAAMKRALKPGVPILKKLTPKGGTKIVRNATTRDDRGRFTTGSGKKKRVRGGALRRAVTSKSKYIGRNRDGIVFGVIGYKAGSESRKAIWLEFGTSKGIRPRQFMEQFRRTYRGPAKAALVKEMRAALEKAVKDKNPGVGSSGYGPGR